MKRAAFAFVLLLLWTWPAQASDLTGVVVDEEGQPLVRATVVTDITGVGTLTDAQGRFTLRLDENLTRVTFSSVGYKARQFRLSEVPEEVVLEAMYIRGEDIVVTADRARTGVTPMAFDNFSQADIARDYTVGEFPLLLQATPNLYAFTDGGAALGYSSMKIRGFDDKRLAIYINGVPLNDPEDHATYFVDLPDFAANVTDIQVQRGVGNSLYGDASFGGSVNIVTSGISLKPKTTLSAGYGEYTSGGKSVSDMYKQSLEYSSGLIDGRWMYTGRFSKQKTGGYRHNSWYHGWSYYFSIARLDPNMLTELYVYGGPMRMHLAYYGAGRDEIEKNRRANPSLTYSNETDNFNQPHYHVHNVYRISDRVVLANTLYYIRGKGYYEQFKGERDYIEYNIDTALTGGQTNGNLVRQKWVEKNQVGWNPRLDVEHDNGRHSVGGSFYYFDSDHWGQVVWAQNVAGKLNPRNKYYQYFGRKYVGSLYAQEYYRLTEKIATQATAQVRYQRYQFDQSKIGAFAGYEYEVDWLIFSPRLGFSYQLNESLSFYTTFSVSSRTPTDEAIYDADDPQKMPSLVIESVSLAAEGDSLYQFGDPTARNERVYDVEIGGQYRSEKYSVGANLFWMDFRNEIIPEGGLSDAGEEITINADRSLHTGLELTGTATLRDALTLRGCFAYNYNRVRDFVTDISDIEVDFEGKKIVGFPDYLGNLMADYNPGPFRVTFRTRFVGRQYMELYNIEELSVDPYSVSSLALSWTLGGLPDVGRLTLQGRIDNLFDKKYEASGYGGNFAYPGENGQTVVDGWAAYFVAAERSFYTQLTLELL